MCIIVLSRGDETDLTADVLGTVLECMLQVCIQLLNQRDVYCLDQQVAGSCAMLLVY